MKRVLLFCCCLGLLSLQAQEPGTNTWQDFKTSLKLIGQASYLQFTQPPSWVLLGTGTATMIPLFHQDDEISQRQRAKGVSDFVDLIGDDLSLLVNLPLVSAVSYWWGRKNGNTKLIRFSMEYFSTLYLALGESALISALPIHDRPNTTNLSHWEKRFRFNSSFPSGHMVGYATLTFKLLQYYGPWAALLPAAATYVTHLNRVRSGRHFASDTVASIFLSALAAEGTRIAFSKQQHLHPFYRLLTHLRLSYAPNSHIALGFTW